MAACAGLRRFSLGDGMPAREHDVNTAYTLGVRPALHSWSEFHHTTSLTALHKTCKQLLFKSCMAAACLQPVMHASELSKSQAGTTLPGKTPRLIAVEQVTARRTNDASMVAPAKKMAL